MSTIDTSRPALPQQLSATLRFATAVVVACLLALAWIGAEQASHQAVRTATAAISSGTATAAKATPAVAVAGRREAAAAKRI